MVQEDREAILSGAFLKLTIRKGVKVKPDYLALVLNSIICKSQIDRLSGGAIIAHLKPSDAMDMTIPVLEDDTQIEICSLEKNRNAFLKQPKEPLKSLLKNMKTLPSASSRWRQSN